MSTIDEHALPPAPKLPGLAVTLPAYNEEENIEGAVLAALEALPSVAEEYEVIIVDDGSSDKTNAIGQRLVAEHGGKVRMLVHRQNIGYGAAITHGFLLSKQPYVFYTDSDLQFDVGELSRCVAPALTHDAVFGFRAYRYDPPLRSVISWTFNRMVDILFRTDVRDVDCAFKIFRYDAFVKLLPDCTDFFIDTELVARARRWDLQIAQVGVSHYERAAGSSTVRPSDIPRTLATLARIWWRIHFPSRDADAQAEARRALNRGLVSEHEQV